MTRIARPVSRGVTAGEGTKSGAHALELAKRLHMAAVGQQWESASGYVRDLRKELEANPQGLSAEDRQVIATRLSQAREAAKRADAFGVLEKIGGVLALGIPFLVDAATTNAPERLQRELDDFQFEKPVATSTAMPSNLPIVDLHADTAMHGLDLGAEPKRSALHKLLGTVMPHSTRMVTLEALAGQPAGGVQVLTAYEEGLPPFPRLTHKFFTQKVGNGLAHGNDTPMNQLVAQLAWIHTQVSKYPDQLALAGPGVKPPPGKHTLQVAIEGARVMSPGKDDAQKLAEFLRVNEKALPEGLPIPTAEELATVEGRLDFLARVGVSYMGLVHLGGNAFAGTDLPFSKQLYKLKHGSSGLTEAGRELVTGMDRRGILIDLAHASEKSQQEVAQMFAEGQLKMPLIVSHGIVDTDGDQSWRDTPLDTLQLVRDSGGVFGVMLSGRYWDKPLEGPTGVVDQIEKAIEVAGIDHVALGSDADGFVSLVVEDMGGVGTIIAEMKRRGFSSEDIEKVCSANYLRTLQVREERLAARSSAPA